MTAESLDTARVVQEAIHAADERGVKDLTMRRLATRMGVQAMALYRHVNGRDALLDAMVATTLNELTVTMTPNTHSSTTGTVYLQDTAYNVRSLALTHPWLTALMLRRPTPASWLSRPLCSLACTESFLEALDHRGYDITSSVTIYRAFNAFLLGHLLVEASVPEDDSMVKNALGRGAPIGHQRAAFPMLVNHLELLAVNDFSAEFERSLDTFLRSVNKRRFRHRPSPVLPPIHLGAQP